jgi:hypothetical protein
VERSGSIQARFLHTSFERVQLVEGKINRSLFERKKRAGSPDHANDIAHGTAATHFSLYHSTRFFLRPPIARQIDRISRSLARSLRVDPVVTTNKR